MSTTREVRSKLKGLLEYHMPEWVDMLDKADPDMTEGVLSLTIGNSYYCARCDINHVSTVFVTIIALDDGRWAVDDVEVRTSKEPNS